MLLGKTLLAFSNHTRGANQSDVESGDLEPASLPYQCIDVYSTGLFIVNMLLICFVNSSIFGVSIFVLCFAA